MGFMTTTIWHARCRRGAVHPIACAQTILGIDPGAQGAIEMLDEGGDLLLAAMAVFASRSLSDLAVKARALGALPGSALATLSPAERAL